MAVNGVGVFQLPIPIILGADKPSGVFNIPMFEVSGVGYTTGGPFSIPIPVVYGTGRCEAPVGLFRVPVPSITAHGYAGVLGTGIFNVPVVEVSGGQILLRGTGTFTIPQFVINTITPGHGVGSVTLPVPIYSGFGTLVPISKVYRGIAMNINNQAISTYSNFNFDSLAYFNGSYYGVNNHGIYKLGGGKDNLTRDIISKIKTGSMNFGDGTIKYLRDSWLTFRSDGHIQVTFLADENEDITSVSQTQLVADNVREEKLKCGRGLKGRFYTMVIENMSGSNFNIEQVGIMIESIRKKLR